MDTLRKIISLGIVSIFILTALPISLDFPDDSNDIKNIMSNEEIYTNRSVAILSDSNVGESISSALSQSTSKLDISDNFNTAKAKDITVIDGDWAASKSISTVENGIKSLIENNNAVIVIDDNADLIKESGANVGLVGFAQDSQAYGMINTSTGQTYCYSVGGMEDINDAVLLAYNWADKTINETNTATTSSSNDWTYKGTTRFVEYCDNRGIMSCNTEYYKLEGSYSNIQNEYYYTHYILNCNPNENYALTYINVYNDVSSDPIHGEYQELYRHQPTSTVGGTAISINLGATIEYNGMIYPVSPITWEYKIPKTTVQDRSLPHKQIMDINHTIVGIDRATGHTIEPGNLICVKKDGGGGYYCTEKYSAEFGEVVIDLGIWNNNFKTYTKSLDLVIK